MGLIISKPQIYCPDRACEENSFVNENYAFQTGSCSGCGWGCQIEKKSSEFDQAEAEASIKSQFEAHKADCKLTKYRELYKQAGTATKKIAVVAQMLGLGEV